MEDNNIRVVSMPTGMKERIKIPRIKFRLSGKMGLLVGVLAILVLTDINALLNTMGIKSIVKK